MTLTRRELLAGAVAFPALAQVGGAAASRLLAHTSIFVAEIQKKNREVSKSQDEVFGSIAKAGFSQVELAPEFLSKFSMAGTKAALGKYKIQVPVLYFNRVMHTREGSINAYQEAISLVEQTLSLGVKAIDLSPEPKPKRAVKSMDEMRIEADCINRIAQTLAKAKVQSLLHNQDAEMLAAASEFKYLLLKTDPSLVKYTLDLQAAVRGGETAQSVLKMTGNRLASLHLRTSVKGAVTETLGDGDVDYRAVAKYLKTAKLSPYLVVDLAYDPATPVTRDVGTNLKMGREYAAKVFA